MTQDFRSARHLKVMNPCSMDWAAMTKQEQGRHCGSCDKLVFDLTDCTEAQANALLAAAGPHPCVRYMADTFGKPVFLAATLAAACTSAHPMTGEPTVAPSALQRNTNNANVTNTNPLVEEHQILMGDMEAPDPATQNNNNNLAPTPVQPMMGAPRMAPDPTDNQLPPQHSVSSRQRLGRTRR